MSLQSVVSVLAAAGLAPLAAAATTSVPDYNASVSVPDSAGLPVLDSFMTFSVEFSSLPDFAGNTSKPNTFSDALLTNLANYAGQKPYLRVGGNTQDYALYDANQTVAAIGIYNTSRSSDYPSELTIGPAYFESYHTLPGTRFSHGFNMAMAINAAGRQALVDSVPLACKALSPDEHGSPRLYTWEFGNEANLYSTSAQAVVRPKTWSNEDYVAEWLNGTRLIRDLLQEHCPGLAASNSSRNHTGLFMAPSFTGTDSSVNAPQAWGAGLDSDNDVELFSKHNYISGAQSLGVTLQGTLMNHSRTASAVDVLVDEYSEVQTAAVSPLPLPPRLILGETNSLYNEGRPGLSNVFGAALWGVDFALSSAAAGIGRVHMHQGTNYRYAAWQPVDTETAPRGTKAPYYANVAVAAALGDSARHDVVVSTLPTPAALDAEADVAHAIYVDGRLARVFLLNMRGYNTTANGSGLGLADGDPLPRGSQNYTLSVPDGLDSVPVQRLLANGSDAITGITWDGWSYNAELDCGRPVRLANVTTGETVSVTDGQVTVTVPDSSAALVSFSGKA